jgi:ABC-type transporter Mla maintaining outer membrane lipid asymmetry ATPase subunit MlaF
MVAPIIELDRISKSFGSHQVLRDLSFTVAPAEKLALIEPSGSGKTTILRILVPSPSLSKRVGVPVHLKLEQTVIVVSGRSIDMTLHHRLIPDGMPEQHGERGCLTSR